ncbi:hypothetical protein RHGRI_010642 [Rhododendron griersonianum]|uniref:Uncharacterized protein n=1 Tax=Rhododendron griersonianum TaxID=479676 RepID=A0AAV6KJ90_9ERIC|nr:hypothetical protein RHGRI_010642 [Rhododendron griersonianum]
MMDQTDRLPTAEIQSFSAETILVVNDVTTLQLHGSKEIKLCVADLESEKAMLLFMEKPKLVGITKWRFEWKGPKVAKFKRFKQIVEVKAVDSVERSYVPSFQFFLGHNEDTLREEGENQLKYPDTESLYWIQKMTEKEISDDEDEKKDNEEKVEDVSCVAVQ